MTTPTTTPHDSSRPHDTHASIRAVFASSSASTPPRPILIHLTPDSSWLLSLPIPTSPHPPHSHHSTSPKANSQDDPKPNSKHRRKRTHYNILIDPWLSGPQIDFNPLFSHQTHATEAAVPTIAALEDLLLDLEHTTIAATTSSSSQSVSSPSYPHTNTDSKSQTFTPPPAGHAATKYESSIDAIVLSHEFTDHTHHDTLIRCSPSIPVFAASKAAAIVRGWGHFELVGEVVEFPLTPSTRGFGDGGRGMETGQDTRTSTPGEWKGQGEVNEDVEQKENGQEEKKQAQARNGETETIDWRAVTHPPNTSTPLPSWLGIARLVEERRHDIVGTRLHSAIMIVFDLSSQSSSSSSSSDFDKGRQQGQGQAESIIYTPHGIPSTSSIISLLSAGPTTSSSHSNTSPAPHSQPKLFPPIRPLLLLHGLHAVTISGGRINLGGNNGATLARSLGVKYWIRTHDEVKDGRGLVGWLLKRRRVSWTEALGLKVGKADEKVDGRGEEGKMRETECREGKAEEQWDRGEDADGVVLTHGETDKEKVEFFHIGNGECRVLT